MTSHVASSSATPKSLAKVLMPPPPPPKKSKNVAPGSNRVRAIGIPKHSKLLPGMKAPNLPKQAPKQAAPKQAPKSPPKPPAKAKAKASVSPAKAASEAEPIEDTPEGSLGDKKYVLIGCTWGSLVVGSGYTEIINNMWVFPTCYGYPEST